MGKLEKMKIVKQKSSKKLNRKLEKQKNVKIKM